MHGTVSVPPSTAGFWRQWRAFVGPAILISVGYMDPGNWGTDLAGGAQFKYGLLWVVALASFMAVILQVLSARLGVATGKDLAQCCRDWYPNWTRWPNWIAMEMAIAATDLAELLGSAVALNLLFHIPLQWAIVITAFDVLLLLALQGMGMRMLEAVVTVFVMTIGVCYGIEIFVLPHMRPDFLEMGRALIHPSFRQTGMLVVAIGMIGATVMPHNLYLHSALVQSRRLQRDESSIRTAIRFNTIDSAVALTVAFLINSAILVLAATVFFGKDSVMVAGGQVVKFGPESDWIRIAHLTLAPLLGTTLASTLFAVALLASGQSSTITGTLAGQVVMEGFMRWRELVKCSNGNMASGSRMHRTTWLRLTRSVILVDSPRRPMIRMAGMTARVRVSNRRTQGRMRQCMKPSMTTCPASVPVMVLLWPLASRATAKSVLAATLPRSGARVR